MNNYNPHKIYGILGKILCGCAGAIIGFLTKGIGLVLLGGIAGVAGGHCLEKAVARPATANE